MEVALTVASLVVSIAGAAVNYLAWRRPLGAAEPMPRNVPDSDDDALALAALFVLEMQNRRDARRRESPADSN